MSVYDEIYDIVQRIPKGSVSSYGRIARMVNCNPRQVGYALAAIPDHLDIPWHRVINSKGEISIRKEGVSDHFQHQKLIDEGVIFNDKGRIDFDRFGWVENEPYLSESWFESENDQ